MITSLGPTEFLNADLPIIDVRSPGEFEQGHIPGAINVPLFTNAERAIVGTLYKQQGRNAAMLEGLRIVGPKMAPIVVRVNEIAPNGAIAVHCWRGGERSASVAWLLEKSGSTNVLLLVGGYKAFRKHALTDLDRPRQLRVIGGYTGSGKTELLQHLKDLNEPILDLEDLANHKGSSYGAIGEDPQPTTEHFENMLWSELSKADPSLPLWVEDESQMIGRVKIPDGFFTQLRDALCFFVDMPREERATRLVADYGKYPVDQLAAATKRIEKRIGPQHCKTAMEALDKGDLHTVAMITLNYYDKTYLHGLEKRTPDQIKRIPASTPDLRSIALKAIETNGEPRAK